MEIAYRVYRDEDRPALERMWREATDWGEFTEQMYQKYFIDAPFGGPLVALATENGTDRILGQVALMPTRLLLNGQEVPAYRPAAPILDKSLRTRSLNPINHPVVQLYRFAMRLGKEGGRGISYSMPDPHWMLLLRMLPGNVLGKFRLWSLPLPLGSDFAIGHGYDVVRLTEFDDRVDRLWQAASGQAGCQVVRNQQTLPGKAGPPEYDVLGVERQGELVGLVCSRQKGDRQWLICDMLAVDDDARRATLMAVANHAHAQSQQRSPDDPIIKTAILATPAMEPVLTELGFTPDKYNFHLVVRVFDESISKDDIAPERWYLSAND